MTDISDEEDIGAEVEWFTGEAKDESDEVASVNKYNLSPSEFTEFAVRVPAGGGFKTFSFEGREYLRQIYDTPLNRRMVVAGRQVEKSTLLGNQILAYCTLNPSFRALYVSPSHQQTKVFSRDRIKEPIETSTVLKSLTSSKLTSTVFEKKFVNNSQVTLRFAFLNADRCRGIPADYVCIDEFQDLMLDNVPVIEECASHSSYRYFTYSGTPKSLDNPIEYYYRRFSTQNEWVVPCRAHGTPNDPGSWHWNLLTEDNIGKNSLVCDRCEQRIYSSDPDSQWAAMNPYPNVEKPFEGFRIPQIMVPWIDWDDILDKQRKYSRPKFFNEVLGLSYDSGVRPLSVADIIANCNQELSMFHFEQVAEKYRGQVPMFMGIDWGCHDDQTRILTPDGFKYFKDLTDDDLVAQFDKDTREASFVKPSVRTVRDWDGDLLHFRDHRTDMMVTPTHRMLSRRSFEDPRVGWVVDSAEDLSHKGIEVDFMVSAQWDCRKTGGVEITIIENGIPTKIAVPAVLLLYALSHYLRTGTASYHLDLDLSREQVLCWMKREVGPVHYPRIPRFLMGLQPAYLRKFWSALMVDADGAELNGHVHKSQKYCEDLQEIAVRIGYETRVTKLEVGGRPLFIVGWTRAKQHRFYLPDVKRMPYKGKVYCCTVPTGFIITERNGKIAYQGNTGEGSYTVAVLAGYLPWDPDKFTFFYAHRFEGPESEPRRQLDIIKGLINKFAVSYVGVDYGGGHWPNDELLREFGFEKIKKYQWVGNVKKKISFEPRLTIPRFLCHRTETMSDVFNGIKRGDVFRFPRWQEFQEPYGADMLNIFSEYNDRLRMNVFKHAPGMPDDTFHAMVFCFLASFHFRRRPDVVAPVRELEREAQRQQDERYDLDIDL